MPDMTDQISRLPDEILCHILSFLPTDEAVATSLLSKRWKNLWTFVSALNLNQYQFCRRTFKPYSSFEKFVDAAILARNLHQPIVRFRIEYGYFDYDRSSYVNDWVNTAMQRGIENLEICISQDYSFIDFRVSSCTTLVVLKLKQVQVVHVSSPVELPSLKSLHLEDVSFELASFWELIRGSPFLEDFKAHSLYFRYHDEGFKQEFRSLPKLVSAVLSDIDYDFPLNMISNAEFLSIEVDEQLSQHLFDKVVPVFPNLVHVVFTSLDSVNWHFVLEILKNCRKLQNFELVLCGHTQSMTRLPYPHFVPECLTSRFRKCSLKNYKATRCERQFAKYIMGNSTSLRTITICSRSSSSTEAKYQMLKELALCTRRSALCELLFK